MTLSVPTLATCPDPAEMPLHLHWSYINTGPVEAPVAAAWYKIDPVAAPSWHTRHDAMVAAVVLANNGTPEAQRQAFEIAIATQLHPSGCPAAVRNAGIAAVIKWLRQRDH